jgi:hypothetical protein
MTAVRKRNEGEKREFVCIFILDYRLLCEEIGLAVTFRHVRGWSTSPRFDGTPIVANRCF